MGWLVTLGATRSAREERLSAYLEAAIDCVVMADASGRVVEFNPAAERTFGYSRNEALGRTLEELIVAPSRREAHRRAFARFAKTREPKLFGRRLELTGVRADGNEFPVLVPSVVHEGFDLRHFCHFGSCHQIFPFHTHHDAAKPTARATAPTFGK